VSDPVPSSAIYDATIGGRSVIVVSGGATGDVLTLQADGTYLPETASVDLSGYVPYAGATAALDLGANAITCGQLTSSALTSGRIPFISTGGLITDTSRLTWDGVSPAVNITGSNTTIRLFPATSAPRVEFTYLDISRAGSQYIVVGGKFVQFVGAGGSHLLRVGGSDIAVTTATGLKIQNGTTATEIVARKTYTSATSFEQQRTGYDATSGLYDVGVDYVGTAGGTNRGKRIGSVNAAGVFFGIAVSTDGKVSTPASTTSAASLNIPDGVAPTSPVDGDMWCIGDVLYRRISGVTKSITFT
jgi:hypothetical protein